MAVNIELVADKVFNLLAGSGYDILSLNAEGETVIDHTEASRFVIKEPNILVRLDQGSETVSMGVREDFDNHELRQSLKRLAVDYLMNFDFKIFGKVLKPKSETIDIAQKRTKEMGDVLEALDTLRTLSGLPTLKEFQATMPGRYSYLYPEAYQLVKNLYRSNITHFTTLYYDNDLLTNYLIDYAYLSFDDATDAAMAIRADVKEFGADLFENTKEETTEGLYGTGEQVKTPKGNIYTWAEADRNYSMYGKFTYEGGEFTMYYDPQMGQFDNREPIQGDPRAQQVINSLPDEYFTNDEKETVISGIIDMILENANTQTEEKNPDGHHHTSNEPFIDPDGPQDEGAYANYVMYVGPNGEELGTEDYDGELEPDMMAQMASDEECKMLCDKHNIDYNDTIGCLKFDDGEATMQDGEELPDGTIAFYGGKDESVEVEELNDIRRRAGLEVQEVSDFKKRELEYELRGEEPKRDPKKRRPYRTPQERIQDANKRNSKEVKKEATTITKNGNTVMADGRPLSFADWRSEVEKESGHPMQRSPEEQKQGYASYLKRANNVWEQIEEGFSTMSGSSKTSYQGLDNVKLIVRHKKEVNEEVRGSRSRNIHSIFVQRGDERFKMSENNLKAARAMARHVKNGGEPFDSVGSAINEMATEQRKLREFVRYVKKSGLVNEENESYVTLAVENIDFITTSFTKLAGVKSYANATEQVLDRTHTEVLQDDIDLEGKFTETHFDNRVANVVDSIKTAMSRKTGFERSIDTAVTTETFDQLKSLLSEDDGMEFATPYAKLGHQVGQMGNSVTNPHLGNYLSGISKKLNNGDRMSQHEYTTVKSCLLGAHQQHEVPVSVAESVEEQYEQFIEQFNIL